MSFVTSPRRSAVVAAALGLALAVPGAAAAVPGAPAPAAATHVIINEVYLVGGSAGQPYTNKFIELHNPTGAAVSLTGWSIQYRSASGTGAFTSVYPLTGSIAPHDYFLIQGGSNSPSAGAALPTPDAGFAGLNPSGTAGTIALANGTTALTPAPGDVAGSPGIVDLVGYGTSNTFEAKAAPAGRGTGVVGSLNRIDFADTDDNSADFTFESTLTPMNSGSADPDPDPDVTAATIAEIQGPADTSPLVGKTVRTEGVVTAAYPTGGFNGLYLQTAGSGGPGRPAGAPSDAVFVYSAAAAQTLAVGQAVEVTGVVSEYLGLTEITPTSDGIKVLGEPAAVVRPTPIDAPGTEAQREALEGMLVQPSANYRVADNYDANVYGSLLLAWGDAPLRQPTTAGRPGSPEAAAATADAKLRAITLDDGSTLNFNTTANKATPLPYLLPGKPVRIGAPVTFTQPVILDYRNSTWNLQPRSQLTGANAATAQPVSFENTRTAGPVEVGGNLTVATFNVLNYFTTTGDQLTGCTYYRDRENNPITVSGGCDARGAANPANLKRQQDKIVAAINALDADVVSLEEIENSSKFGKDRDDALGRLVAALNADAGAGTWAFVPSPAALPAQQDVIRTAFIYQAATAEPIGLSTILDDAAFTNARQPLAQVFQPATGDDANPADDVVVVANHFKSKGSGSGEDADQGDGQGPSNASRVKQAKALRDFATRVADAAGTDKILLVGDFNAYEQEDPIAVLTDAGYTDIGPTIGKYSYVYDGLVGSLDHVLASPAAKTAMTGADIWNINSVEPIAAEYSRYNYNVTLLYEHNAFRASDHDPFVVGLNLTTKAATKTIDLIDINDFHGRIDANTVKFAGTVEAQRAKNPAGSVFVSVGDNIGASLFASAMAADKPTLDVLNALDLGVSSVGNHEFDQGLSDLTGRVQDAADWNYLGANVYDKGTTTPALPEYQVLDVDGVRLGFVGVVTQETPTLVSPAGVASVDFGDPVAALNRVTARLQDGNAANGEADVVVALVHDGAGAGTPDGATLAEEVAAGGAFAEIVTEADPRVAAILTGHTHKYYAWDAPVPGAEGRTRPVLQTGSYGENVGHIALTIDLTTRSVTGYTAENIARSTAVDADLVAAYPRVAEVKRIVDAALAEADRIGSEKIGSLTADVTTAFLGGSYVAGKYVGPGPTPTTGRDDRANESTMGRLVADSLLATLKDPDRGGADIGVVNPGGLRAELLYGADGSITYAAANNVLPFVNNLWTISLTGAQVKTMLEQQWQTNPDGTRPSRSFLALGLSRNVTYTVDTADPNATPGNHITSITINGKPIDPAATYRIATFSFLATGGDNFRVFNDGTNAKDSGLIDRDAWIAYLAANSPVGPSFDRTSVVVDSLPGPVQAGGSASVRLSRLDLTSLGAPANTAVTAYLTPAGTVFDPAAPGAVLGTATVSGGAGALPVTVPAGTAAGDYGLHLVVAPAGTVVRIPLTVTARTGVVLTDLSAAPRCLAGRAYLAISAVNGDDSPVDISFDSAFGPSSFAAVGVGKTAYRSITTRMASLAAGTVTITGTVPGTARSQAYTVTYPATTCG